MLKQNLLDCIIFRVKSDEMPKELYMKVKVKNFIQNRQSMKLLQLTDVTTQILYMEIKAQSEFSSLINTIMSHELRNPLNSIIAKNIEKSALYSKMRKLLESCDGAAKLST